MINKIIKFFKYLFEPKVPHIVSKVQCDICTHKWVAIRPVGLTELQCPNCKLIVTFDNI